MPGRLSLVAILFTAGVASADSLLVLQPDAVELRGPLDRVQVLTTLVQADARPCTTDVSWASADPRVVTAEDGYLVPRGDGTTTVTARLGSVRASVVVAVTGMASPPRVSFRREALPALVAAGCSQGGCHGAVAGRGGFKLSLRGSDPDADFFAIARASFSRRVDRLTPTNSLLVRKGAGLVEHEAEPGLLPGQPTTEVLLAWIGQGALDDPAGTPRLDRIDVLGAPAGLLHGKELQLAVRATDADGRQADVTRLTTYQSSDPETAEIDRRGRVRFHKTGEVAVLCRHLDRLATVRLTHVEHRPDFVWAAPPPVNDVDRIVFAKLRKLQLPPADLCSDATFLRRACLDLGAFLPPPDMLRTFVADPDVKKREKLVDHLLDRGDFADFWARHWLDALGYNAGRIDPRGADAYRRWMRGHLLRNTPFDVVVRELLTARGSTYDVGPANFYRHHREPADRAEAVANVFLGVRLDCARCHAHPSDRWTPADHAGLTAFFARVRSRPDPADKKTPRPETVTVAGRDDRAWLAGWLTAKDNPYFARAVVNRVWSHLLGRGVADPVDDLRDANPSSNDELLDALARDFVETGYDLKRLVRTIATSATYQLASTARTGTPDETRYFSRAYPRRLTAEQLTDAIAAVTEVADIYEGRPAGTRAVQVANDAGPLPWLGTISRPARELACECDRESPTLASALHLLGSDGIQKKLQDPRNRIGRLLAAKLPEREMTDELFLATFARLPTDKERQQVAAHLLAREHKRSAWEDILWALLNTKEFLFRG